MTDWQVTQWGDAWWPERQAIWDQLLLEEEADRERAYAAVNEHRDWTDDLWDWLFHDHCEEA